MTQLPTLLDLIRRQDAALAAKQAVIDAVTELHRPGHTVRDLDCWLCEVCTTLYPCLTAAALALPDITQEDDHA